MVRKMINPFQFGGPIGDDAFCNRRNEIRDLSRTIQNRRKIFIYSERASGKTSLVKYVLDRLPSREYRIVYVDLLATDDEYSFVIATARAFTDSLNTPVEKAIIWAKKFLSHLRPVISIDDEGKPVIKFEISRSHPSGTDLEAVLSIGEQMYKADKKKVVVVFDEIQQITLYGDDLVERKLRSVIQHHRSVPYIFLGSSKHLVQRMFLDRTRPLYHIAIHYPLPPIAEKDWVPFIRERFMRAEKNISEKQILAICKQTQGHPFYTQHLCHAVWELADAGTTVTDTLIDEAVDLLIRRENTGYFAKWDTLTKNQQRLLKGLAHEGETVKPFDSAFMNKYGIGPASSVQRSVQLLIEKDIIDRENGAFIILDRFLRLWIRKTQII